MSELLSERTPPLHLALRAATAAAHTRLETTLALINPPLERARFLTVLQGFWGFHRVWEPMLAERKTLAPLLAGRGRLAILERDLAALGMTMAEIESLPRCQAVTGLEGSDARLLGSIYVVEGSTLGGQVIGKALGGESWLPAGGLAYFNPYAAQTGAMWRDLRSALEAASSPAADEQIISGAQDTFTLLRDWLGPMLGR